MKSLRFAPVLLGIGLFLASAAAVAAGNAQAGWSKAMYCAGCHGTDGNATYLSARLAGQSTQRLTQSLMDYKAGKRFHPMMNIITMGLTQQDVEDIAMYYAAQKPASLEHASLYWRLGGGDALNAAVDEIVKVAKADPRLNGRITGACSDKLKELLCAETGGPCAYTGRDMKTAHKGLHITEAEFNAVADDLVKVLTSFKVPEKEQNELVGLIAPMKGDIVGH